MRTLFALFVLLLAILISCADNNIPKEVVQMAPPPPPPPLPGSPIEGGGNAGYFGRAVPTWATWAADPPAGSLSVGPLTASGEVLKTVPLTLSAKGYDRIYSTFYATDADKIINTPQGSPLNSYAIWLPSSLKNKAGTFPTSPQFIEVTTTDTLQGLVPASKLNPSCNTLKCSAVVVFGCILNGVTRKSTSGGIGTYVADYKCNAVNDDSTLVEYQVDEPDGQDRDQDGNDINRIANSVTASGAVGRWTILPLNVEPPEITTPSMLAAPMPNPPAKPTTTTGWGPAPSWVLFNNPIDTSLPMSFKLANVQHAYIWTEPISSDANYWGTTTNPTASLLWKPVQLYRGTTPLTQGTYAPASTEFTGSADATLFDAAWNTQGLNRLGFFGCTPVGISIVSRTPEIGTFKADYICSGGSQTEKTSTVFKVDLTDGKDALNNDGQDGDIEKSTITQIGFAGLWQPAVIEAMPKEANIIADPIEPSQPGAFAILTALTSGSSCQKPILEFPLSDSAMSLCQTYAAVDPEANVHVSGISIKPICSILTEKSIGTVMTCSSGSSLPVSICASSDKSLNAFTDVQAVNTGICPTGYEKKTGYSTCSGTRYDLCVKGI